MFIVKVDQGLHPKVQCRFTVVTAPTKNLKSLDNLLKKGAVERKIEPVPNNSKKLFNF